MTAVVIEFYGLLQYPDNDFNYTHNLINFNDRAGLRIKSNRGTPRSNECLSRNNAVVLKSMQKWCMAMPVRRPQIFFNNKRNTTHIS
jgi:hypothetical protein